MSEKIGKFTTSEWYELLMGESLLFGLLGRVLYANPSRDWLEPFIEADLFDDVPFAENQPDTIEGLKVLAQWRASLGETLTDSALRDLRADYAQLFIGNNPMRVPPWESVYFSEKRLTFQQETMDVRNWYQRLGLMLSTDNREPSDHIALELSFVAHCAKLASQAQNEQQPARFDELLTVQREFLEKHLLRWGGKWTELACDNARTDFYRGLALVVRGGLKELTTVFAVEIPQNIMYPGLVVRQQMRGKKR